MRTRNPRFGAQKSPPILTASQGATQLLDNRTVLLEYKICGAKTYAWVVTPEKVSVAELPGREAIRELVSRLTLTRDAKDTVDADEAYWKAAQGLSDAILGPVAPLLTASKLLLVADDSLQQVAFGGLPWPAEPGRPPAPLIERFSEITSIPSAS